MIIIETRLPGRDLTVESPLTLKPTPYPNMSIELKVFITENFLAILTIFTKTISIYY